VKAGKLEKKTLDQGQEPTTNMPGSGYEPEPHDLEASALATSAALLKWSHAMLLVTLYFLFVFIREARENILHQSRTMNITP